MSLYSFGESEAGYVPLIPGSNNSSGTGSSSDPVSISKGSSTPSNNIDLVNKYAKWSATNNLNLAGIADIPSIVLKENVIKSSTLLMQTLYSVGVATESTKSLIDSNRSFLPKAVGDFLDITADKLTKSKDETIDSLDDKFFDDVKSLNLGDINDILTSKDPYKYLYNTDPTNFEYVFPFFETPITGKSGSYQDSYGGDGLNTVFDTAARSFMSFVDTSMQGVNALTTPGLYIENNYYYTPTDGKSLTFSIPLINTFNKDDLEFNTQLIWLLLYQNSIKRINKISYVPPCIYEVIIPGRVYMQHAYISNLEVKFNGNRRRINVNMPRYEGGVSETEMIVPESYQLSITIQNLTTETGDLLLKSAE